MVIFPVACLGLGTILSFRRSRHRKTWRRRVSKRPARYLGWGGLGCWTSAIGGFEKHFTNFTDFKPNFKSLNHVDPRWPMLTHVEPQFYYIFRFSISIGHPRKKKKTYSNCTLYTPPFLIDCNISPAIHQYEICDWLVGDSYPNLIPIMSETSRHEGHMRALYFIQVILIISNYDYIPIWPHFFQTSHHSWMVKITISVSQIESNPYLSYFIYHLITFLLFKIHMGFLKWGYLRPF